MTVLLGEGDHGSGLFQPAASDARMSGSLPLCPPYLAFVRHRAEQVQRQPGREHARQVSNVECRHDFHEVEANDLTFCRYAAEQIEGRNVQVNADRAKRAKQLAQQQNNPPPSS